MLLILIPSIWFLCPSQIASVLEELRCNQLKLIQSPTSDTHRARRSAASATSTDVVTQTWQFFCIPVQLQAVFGNNLVNVGSVQDEQQGTQNGPLWYSELHWTNGRQLTVIGDLLRLADNELHPT